jgi:hypothetical protein
MVPEEIVNAQGIFTGEMEALALMPVLGSDAPEPAVWLVQDQEGSSLPYPFLAFGDEDEDVDDEEDNFDDMEDDFDDDFDDEDDDFEDEDDDFEDEDDEFEDDYDGDYDDDPEE